MKTPSQPGVKIADLKAHLSKHLHTVRAGGEIVVLDRKTPIARIVPYEARTERLVIREALHPWGTAKLPPLPRKRVDAVALLLEDRARR